MPVAIPFPIRIKHTVQLVPDRQGIVYEGAFEFVLGHVPECIGNGLPNDAHVGLLEGR